MKQKLLKKLYKILAFLARNYLKKTNPFIIGITGSVGKTSCRMIITQVIKSLNQDDLNTIYTSPKNFNSEIGLVLSVFQIEKYTSSIFGLFNATLSVILKSFFSNPKYKTIVLEYGIDHPGDMDFLLTIAKPDIAIFTKLDKVHSENFENNVEAVGDEKFKLIYSAKKQVYLNFNDEYCKKNASNIQVPVKYIFGGDIEIQDLKIDREEKGIFSTFTYNSKQIKTNLFGEENLNYISLGVDIYEEMINWRNDKLKKLGNDEINFIDLQLQPGRFSLFSGINHSILVDSTYNASPESMKKMILNTFSLRDFAFPNYKIGFVIGDMRELGELSEASHKEIASYLLNADFVYTVGNETKNYLIPELNGKIENLKSFITSKDAGFSLKEFIVDQTNEYIILFKGSQNTIFTEEALKQLLSHKIDEKKLVRQSEDWIKKKEEFFNK